jgi:hypothetical protein
MRYGRCSKGNDGVFNCHHLNKSAVIDATVSGNVRFQYGLHQTGCSVTGSPFLPLITCWHATTPEYPLPCNWVARSRKCGLTVDILIIYYLSNLTDSCFRHQCIWRSGCIWVSCLCVGVRLNKHVISACFKQFNVEFSLVSCPCYITPMGSWRFRKRDQMGWSDNR